VPLFTVEIEEKQGGTGIPLRPFEDRICRENPCFQAGHVRDKNCFFAQN
jgi:hypothetical protein